MLHESHPLGANADDGNGQALRVGDYKLVFEKGPEWHGPPNDLWYESGSNPSLYNHTIRCGPPPARNASTYCSKLPCLFNIERDPCEYVDLSKAMPQKLGRQHKSQTTDRHTCRGATSRDAPERS